MIYIYRLASSTGARELVNGLLDADVAARRWSSVRPREPRQQDKIVCWGQDGPVRAAQTTLNAAAMQSKYTDALKLKEAGVATIEVSRTRPLQIAAPQPAPEDPAIRLFLAAQAQANDFAGAIFSRTAPFQTGVRQVFNAVAALDQALATPAPAAVPAPPPIEWLGRQNNHVGGNDLLQFRAPDFFVKKETLVEEYRIHSFLGRSIRAGKKVVRDGFAAPHEWIRSYDGGWKINYDGFESSKQMRDLAAKAVKALGLDFGAVDIGLLPNRSLMVLEVNRAPGLEGGTVTAYVNAVIKWSRGEE